MSNPLLDALLRNESGGRNIANTDEGTTSGQAQGHFQITTGTWKDFGGDKYAPTPLGATYAQQADIASKIPLKRWDSSTINAMRATGMPVDPSQTLGQNLGGNFNSDKYGLITRPGLNMTSVPVAPGAAAPALSPPINVPDMPVAQAAAGTDPAAPAPVGSNPIMDAITKLTTPGANDKPSPLGALAKAFNPSSGGGDNRPTPIIQTGALQSSDALQGQQLANAQQLMQTLLMKRKPQPMLQVPGLGITGMMG